MRAGKPSANRKPATLHRERIEQAIARHGDILEAAYATGCHPSEVEQVWRQMDLAAAS